MHRTTVPCALAAVCLFACGDDTAGSADGSSSGAATTGATGTTDTPTTGPTTGDPPAGDARIYLHFGADISSAVATRVSSDLPNPQYSVIGRTSVVSQPPFPRCTRTLP